MDFFQHESNLLYELQLDRTLIDDITTPYMFLFFGVAKLETTIIHFCLLKHKMINDCLYELRTRLNEPKLK